MSDFKAKCTKIDFGWGLAPDPTGSAYRSPSWIKGPTGKGRNGIAKES